MLKTLIMKAALVAFLGSISFAAFAIADTQRFEVPAGDLAAALESLAKQANVDLVYQHAQVKGLRTAGVSGNLSPRDAVVKLLEGTPLEIRTDEDSGAILITTPTPSGGPSPQASEASDNPSPGTGEGRGEGKLKWWQRVAQAPPLAGPAERESEGSRDSGKDEGSQSSVEDSGGRLIDEIIVTGSRLAQQQLSNGPQDVKVYTREQITQSGRTTISEFINTLPEVSTAVSENGLQSNAGGTTVRLRGMPIGTTLVLINGRRVHNSPAQQGYGVFFDLNNIPLAAVERIEIAAEGSSAVYGSDAIAGVVNIVLNQNVAGFEAAAKYGQASGTDETNLAVLWGERWNAGGLSMIGSYQSRSALQGFERSSVVNGVDPGHGGTRDFSSFYRYSCSPGNVFFPNGFSFDGGQTTVQYAAVPAGSSGTATIQDFAATAGTLNTCSDHTLYGYADFIPATDRAGMLISADYQPTRSTELSLEVMYSKVKQSQGFAPSVIFIGRPGLIFTPVPAANPYNPFGETVGVTATLQEAGMQGLELRSEFFRSLIGVDVDLPGDWKWETAAWISQDDSDFSQSGLGDAAAITAARSSSDPAAALNPFVANPGSSQGSLQSLIYPDILYRYLGRTVSANSYARGPLLELPSGPLTTVLGVEFNRDTFDTNVIVNPTAVEGERNQHRESYAVFSEARIPLVRDRGNDRGGDTLALTAAGRYDHYSDFGSETTPQLGAEWRPFGSLLVRGTYANAFKAPSLPSLYAPVSTFQLNLADPQNGNQVVPVLITEGGNPNLQPETGESYTVGFVYSSRAMPGLRFSATHWSIEEGNSIQSVGFPTILSNENFFPGHVTRDANGTLVAIRQGYVNFGQIDLQGVDYAASYKLPTSIGEFAPSLNATQTYRYVTALTPSAPPTDGAGKAQDTGNFAPVWKGTASLGWKLGSLTSRLDGRYVSHYQDYGTTRDIGNFWLYDASLRFDFGRVASSSTDWFRGAHVTLGVLNLMDTLPQDSSYGLGLVGYDPTQGDLRGRYAYAEIGIGFQ